MGQLDLMTISGSGKGKAKEATSEVDSLTSEPTSSEQNTAR
jgi:hypothetical protein